MRSLTRTTAGKFNLVFQPSPTRTGERGKTLTAKKSLRVADALGFALGCVGLSLADFCALTPSEFHAVCDAWGRQGERLEQGAWERMRLLATITIQPHVKKRLTPGQLLPLPWEEERRPKAVILPVEQDKARLERLLGKRRGG